MPYQFSAGRNNAAGLVTVSIEPATTDGLQVPVVYAASGAVKPQGAFFTVWVYASLTRTQYSSLRTAFGLSDLIMNVECTVKTKGNDGIFSNYSATMTHVPGENGKRDFVFWTGVQFVLKGMQAL